MKHFMQKLQHVNSNGVIFAFDRTSQDDAVHLLVYATEEDLTPTRDGKFNNIKAANAAANSLQKESQCR